MRLLNGASASRSAASARRHRDDPIRVLVVDDHPVVRKGVAAIIACHAKFEVVGEARDGLEALDVAEAVRPGIVVIDLAMPRLGGAETIVELRRRLPLVEVLVFTMHGSEQAFVQAMEAGARAYVCKQDTGDLLTALEAVARREAYISPAMREALSQDTRDEAWDRRPLTDRERQIVRLVARGQTNKQIARLLDISVKTTETHRLSAMRKTGTNSAAELTIYALRNGIVEL
jgi:DNA-binding NarL/FixJ family response regulator